MTVPSVPTHADFPFDGVDPLDVRPLLLKGIDPYDTVIAAAARTLPGGRLTLDAPFNPVPLRRALAGRGFSSQARKLDEGWWRIVFVHDGAVGWEDRAEGEILPEGAMLWIEADGHHLDVRRLPPPDPLRAILRLVESLSGGGTIIVHHDRDPVFLAPELAERGWRIARTDHAPAEIRLWLEPETR